MAHHIPLYFTKPLPSLFTSISPRKALLNLSPSLVLPIFFAMWHIFLFSFVDYHELQFFFCFHSFGTSLFSLSTVSTLQGSATTLSSTISTQSNSFWLMFRALQKLAVRLVSITHKYLILHQGCWINQSMFIFLSQTSELQGLKKFKTEQMLQVWRV